LFVKLDFSPYRRAIEEQMKTITPPGDAEK
jgi:hypothetical protein